MDTRDGIASIGTARCEAIGCAICAGIVGKTRAETSRPRRFRRFRKGETVLAEADEIGFVGNVVSGVLRMHKTLPDGRQVIVGLLLPADMFGRVFTHTSNVAIEAAIDATLCCFNRLQFEKLFERFPELEHRTVVSISHELDAAQDWMLLLATQSVIERVATFLLILSRRTGPHPAEAGMMRSVHVPVARRDMAAYLGTTVESISRSIQHMARSGVVRIIDPQNFVILDPRRLVELSGHTLEEFDLPAARLRRLG
jgi:CRP/FNR family transcriptional regulator, anaerobic regulatory protein